MLGDDDIGVLIDEPITAADLFGEDEGEIPQIPPLSPNANDPPADAPPGGETAAADAAAPAKKRSMNRLPNLNERWVTDPKKEGMYSVNKYFENIKFKPGKGNELKTLNTVLRRYEYWAQQCYPKFCFKDVVDKLEGLSAKKPIKNALVAIRNNINPFENIADEDNGEVNNVATNNLGDGNLDDGVGSSVFPPIVNDIPSTPTQHSFDSFAAPTPPVKASASTPIAEDMKEIIRRKREAAIAKRKRKIEESMNTSASSSASQAGGEASLDISSITIPESGVAPKNSENDDLEASLNYSMSSTQDTDLEKVMNEESPLNSTCTGAKETMRKEKDETRVSLEEGTENETLKPTVSETLPGSGVHDTTPPLHNSNHNDNHDEQMDTEEHVQQLEDGEALLKIGGRGEDQCSTVEKSPPENSRETHIENQDSCSLRNNEDNSNERDNHKDAQGSCPHDVNRRDDTEVDDVVCNKLSTENSNSGSLDTDVP